MSGTDVSATSAFAAFRQAVFDDPALARALRGRGTREAFVAQAVALGAARGFTFDEAAVRAAMRAGEERWMMLGADVV